MKRILNFTARAMPLLLAVFFGSAGCTLKSQDPPPLTGPSEFGTSIVITVSPDVLRLDGASQSLVTIIARDPNGNAVRNLSLTAEISVGGLRAALVSISARNLVTDSNGGATLVYTAPAAPSGPAVDPDLTVQILVTPIGTDAANAVTRLASIRLIAPGVVIPRMACRRTLRWGPRVPPITRSSCLLRATIRPSRVRSPVTRLRPTRGTSAMAQPAADERPRTRSICRARMRSR